jgi:hypothetical protein
VGPPNPEAVAWYVGRAQIAGFGAAVLALLAGNATVILQAIHSSPRALIGELLLIAAAAITASLFALFVGLCFSLMSVGTLVVELI